MKKIYILLITLFVFENIKSQNLNWLWANDASTSSKGEKIKTDTNGNVYVGGSFSGTVSIGSTTLTSNGLTDIFIAKYNTNGNLLWVKNFGGSGNEYVNGLVIDSNNDIILTSSFNSSIVVISTTTLVNTSADYDAVILKLNTNGNYIWHQLIKGVKFECICDLFVDSFNNILITGVSTSNTLTVGGTNLALTTTINAGYSAKFSSIGVLNWVSIEESNNSNSFGHNLILSDNQGNVFVEGYSVISTTNSAINIGTSTLANIPSGNNDFVIKYNASGIKQWIKPINTNGVIGGTYKMILDNANNILIVGLIYSATAFGSTTITPTGVYDAVVVKFDNNMNYIWAKNFTSSNISNPEYYSSVAVDAFNNVIVTAKMAAGTCSFATYSYSNSAIFTIFINKYNQNGAEIESTQLGITGSNVINDIAIDNTGYYYVTGTIQSSTLSIGSTTINSNGTNMFVAKGAPIALGISKNKLLENIKVYPNPFTNKFFITKSNSKVVSITILNGLGLVLIKQSLSNNSIEIDLNSYPQGTYFVEILEPDGTRIVRKVVKE